MVCVSGGTTLATMAASIADGSTPRMDSIWRTSTAYSSAVRARALSVRTWCSRVAPSKTP